VGAEGRCAPREQYAQRLAARRDDVARRARVDGTLANLRLAVFAAGALAAWLAFAVGSVSAAWVGLAAALFAVLVVVHDRAIRARRRAERAAAFYEAGLARLDGRWVGAGVAGEERRDPAHPYADDLDLFGRGSLFERLCAARTREGEDALARWLLAPAGVDEVRARQAAVAELRERLDLREDLALLGEPLRTGLHAAALRRWGEAPAALPAGPARAVAALLPLLTLAGLAAFFAGAGPLPFEAGVLLQAAFAWRLRPRVRAALRGLELPARDLALLGELLARLERERFAAPRLVGLRAALDGEGRPASQRIARLRRLVELLDARRNQLFAPVAALLLWSTQLAFAIERWRLACGPALSRWTTSVGELEALASLAGYAWECPDHAFPEVDAEAPLFDAEGLGHPLLPEDRCVRNDLRLAGPLRVLVVSGSNMSGKSTLLRAVGANAVLALAGAPVCARRLRLAPLAIGASIQLHDSLLEGRSRFYAEIERLRQIVTLAEGERSVLFLLDEILHGTNSHDRGIGAAAIVRGLLERGAGGLVTTHDLALARIADELAPRAANVHFEDQLEEGRIAFDYRLRPGVVRKGNALALMRAVGLEV
jgi:MutS domain V